MTWGQIVLIAVLAIVAVLASYISRVYSEFGKILPREVQDNLDAWEERIEPHIGLSRDHASLCAAVLHQLALVFIALDVAAILLAHADHGGLPPVAELGQAILAVILVVTIFGEL